MIIKLIIFLAAGYFVLKALKGIAGHSARPRMEPGRDSRQDIDDLMVKDPCCHTYIPKREAIRVRHNGVEYYFCSAKCRDTYLTKP